MLAVAAPGSQLASFDVVIRCLLAAAATGMMFEAFQKRRYSLGVVSAGHALPYNPVAPVFSLSGKWQGAHVALSNIPFAVSLAQGVKKVHVD